MAGVVPFGLAERTGLLRAGHGVDVGVFVGFGTGVNVAVGGIGVFVGTGVAVGGIGVAVGGTGVLVGMGVADGGTGVFVGGGVLVAATVGEAGATTTRPFVVQRVEFWAKK